MGWKKKAGWTLLSTYLFARGCWEAEYRIAKHVAEKSPFITSTARIEEIVLEEAQKLGVDGNFEIQLNLKEEYYPIWSGYDKSRDMHIINIPITFKNVHESSIRHEMFHIAQGHTKEKELPYLFQKLRFYLLQEPGAVKYEATQQSR